MEYAKHCRCSGFYKKETRRECKVGRKKKSVRRPEKILQIEGWINEIDYGPVWEGFDGTR